MISKFFIKTTLLASIFGIAAAVDVAWASPSSLTYQGRILRSNGTPLEYKSVGFIFELTSPDGYCVIYRELKSGVNMVNSGGVFDITIGSGVRQYPPSGTTRVTDYFDNTKIYNCTDENNADTGSTYKASAGDGRKLRVSFWDGIGWQVISPDNEIRSVPYASYSITAEKIGNIPASNVAKKTDLPTANCSANEVLTFANGAFSCVQDQLGTSGGGIMGLNGEEGSSQSLAVNVGGTALLWNSASGIHTLKIPLAATSGVSAGLLSNTDYNIFSGKQEALGFTPLHPANNLSDLSNTATARVNLGLSAAGGDLTGTLPNPTLAKIQGKDVILSGLTGKDVLSYDGGKWINKQLTASDVSGLTLGNYVPYSVLPANCTTNKTLVFLTPSNTFDCSDIAINNTQVSGLGTLATLSPAGTANSSTFLRGDGAWSSLSAANIPNLDATKITSGYLDIARLPTSVTNALWTESAGNVYRSSGNVGVGTTTPMTALNVYSTQPNGVAAPYKNGFAVEAEGTNYGYISSIQYSDAKSAYFHGYRARGNKASPQPLLLNDVIAGYSSGGYDGTAWSYNAEMRIIATEDWNSSNHGTGIVFNTTQNGTNSYAEKMRIDSNGLRVQSGEISVKSGNNTNNSVHNGIHFITDNDSYFSAIRGYRDSASTKNGLSFFTSNGATPSEVVRIDPAGNVGIGTTNPTSKLHVAGDIQIGNSSATCSATTEGAQRYNATLKRMEYCDGTSWQGVGAPAGAIQAFSQSACPAGWLAANGSVVSRTTYGALFTAITTSYGAGDGSTTFTLPDYRGYFLRGWNNGSGADPDAASRTDRGDGTTGDAVGTKQLDQFKNHNHGVNDPGHSHAQATTNGAPQTPGREVAGATGYGYDYADGLGAIPTDKAYTGISTQNTGGTESRPKNINVLYCIKY